MIRHFSVGGGAHDVTHSADCDDLPSYAVSTCLWSRGRFHHHGAGHADHHAAPLGWKTSKVQQLATTPGSESNFAKIYTRDPNTVGI